MVYHYDRQMSLMLVFCLRYVDANLEVHKEFIGLYNLERTNAE